MRFFGLHGEYVSPWDAAEILGVSVETLRFWRYTKRHAEFISAYYNASRRVFYKRSEVEFFSRVRGCPTHVEA